MRFWWGACIVLLFACDRNELESPLEQVPWASFSREELNEAGERAYFKTFVEEDGQFSVRAAVDEVVIDPISKYPMNPAGPMYVGQYFQEEMQHFGALLSPELLAAYESDSLLREPGDEVAEGPGRDAVKEVCPSAKGVHYRLYFRGWGEGHGYNVVELEPQFGNLARHLRARRGARSSPALRLSEGGVLV